MKSTPSSSLALNAMVIFWLGVLTGAIFVGLVFLYRAVSSGDIDAALLRYNSPAGVTSATTSTKSAKSYKAVPPPPAS